jgi:opacity protein-like surface antigen
VLFFVTLGVAQSAEARQFAAEPAWGFRGFVDFAPQAFVAHDTFDAIFDHHWGTFIGGGGQVRWKNLLFEASASHFDDSGQRVFVSGDEVFKLGIPTKVTIVPLEFTGAYRFRRVWRLRPYAGGGFGRQSYKETSDFADASENVKSTTNSYHVVGGAEIGIWRWIAAGAEVRYRGVPDAIGEGGASREFGEDNLGGTSFRVRILVIPR